MKSLKSALAHPNPSITRIHEPYPMWIVDNFFTPEIPQKVNQEWPTKTDTRWHNGITYVGNKQSVLERNLQFIDKPELYPNSVAEIVGIFHSSDFMKYLSELTGIDGLFPDDTHRWSGMRSAYEGSFQLIHRDAVRHPENGFCRKLTILYYLNEDYKKNTHEGCLEVWDKTMQVRMHEIEPINNRLLVFLCTETSYHGVPKVLHERRFIMSSAMTAEETPPSERALFVARPDDDIEVKIQGNDRSHY